jgi:hypothetical protein
VAEYLIETIRRRLGLTGRERPGVWLTHDVDAIGRTAIHTAKQAAGLALQDWPRVLGAVARFVDFAVARDSLNHFDRIRELEGDLSSTVFVYAGGGARFRDPDYGLSDPRVRDLIRRSDSVGCHASAASSVDAEAMRVQREALERVAGRPVAAVRQHWLNLDQTRSSEAYARAGFSIDCSLGFNERWGFRNGMARPFRLACGLTEIPLALMDQHLYWNRRLTRAERRLEIAALLDEVVRFGGCVSIDWHTQTMGRAYGWGQGYEDVLAAVRERKMEARVYPR